MNPDIKQNIIRWIPAVLYAVMIFYFSSVSFPPSPELLVGLSISSSVQHYIEYFIFGLLLLYALWKEDKRIAWAIAIGAFYAATDEIHQFFVPGRTMDIMDFAVDILGIITGIIIINIIIKLKKNNSNKKSSV
jgi:VanZ family protein